MSYGRNPECVFTQVFFPDNGEEGAAPTYIVPDLSEDATEDQLEEAMRLEVCPRTTCRLTCGDLMRYVMNAGEVAPLDKIAQQVPSDCSWNDVPHDGEIDPIT